jgi:selenocysteine-specific elongation factor
MKNLIMGTAGHIDHGKTELIRALTNIDCDTHPEEKKRGITINLGFANLKISEKISIGIVDVPGHRDFINTMVAGAFGIDFVLLVIAADSGIMPQTVEHVEIMELLGVKHGLVAITKADLVEKEILETIRGETIKFLSSTVLKNSEIIDVSSLSGYGMKDLVKSIKRTAHSIKREKSSKLFRMFIDRAFSVKGFGTVITGSSLGGNLNISEEVWLLPSEKKVRIRRIEQYGKEVEGISGAGRVSLNLAGISKNELIRGSVICSERLTTTMILDANLTIFNNKKSFGIWFNAIFILGTFMNLARIHLINSNKLESGKTAIVQIHLSKDAMIMRGDKFIIRDTSSEFTLGGGEVIDAYPLHHKRRPSSLVNQLNKISGSGVLEFISHEVQKHDLFISGDYLQNILNIKETNLLKSIVSSDEDRIKIIKYNGNSYFITPKRLLAIEERVISSIAIFHRKNRLYGGGKKLEDFYALLKIERSEDNEKILKAILNELVKRGKIKKVSNSWALSSHRVLLTDEEKMDINHVEDFFLGANMHVPITSEITNERFKLNIPERKFQQIMKYLVHNNKLHQIEGNFIHKEIVDKCRIALLEYLSDNPDGITVARFRDLVHGNRKICILLLNIYDSEGLTARNGDMRFITENGNKYLMQNERAYLS